ncbi:DUF2939 domain-containing protein [Sphingomonas sanxanigenens]|uniref:DUF2939 domain-containing protein n=1 Tax=Sphingomonas sanxanigenens DSM 19645 = NX02 TaxID=1123269 RepID=W0AJS3_9SPHN|nr:DUF2939 domain-containing protein [Sphingomonas sanxanigenens]AHE56518.1 hypothetical protein NX02_24555 [Sphingomonas sanxanigenens DSM 19645 = NX02]
MKRIRLILIGVAALLLLVLGAAGWFYGSPVWTLRQMQRAADDRDAATLSTYVDFPAFRAAIAAELTDELADHAGGRDSGLGALAATFGGPLVDRAVDALITPNALRRVFASEMIVDDGSEPEPLRMKLGKSPQIDRRSLSEFRVSPRDRKGELIFRRDGLGWKLVGIDMPREGGAAEEHDAATI